MDNNDNKRQLIQLLCTYHISEKVELVSYLDCMAGHDEADITLISCMLHAVREGAHRVRIQCDDTGIFVVLVYWSWKANVEADVRFEKWDGAVLSINDTVVSLGAKCKGILATHVLCGCDTTSFPCARGKTMSLNVLMDNGFEDELDATFDEEEVTHDQIMEIGSTLFLALYAQKPSPTVNAARYAIFRKSKKAPPLKNLPPTDCNALIHFLRVHGQCGKTRPSYCRHMCACGWEVKDGVPMPAVYPAPIVPPKLLDVVRCQCGTHTLKTCTTSRYSCRRAGLPCTSYCACAGEERCENSHTHRQHGEDEDEEDSAHLDQQHDETEEVDDGELGA